MEDSKRDDLKQEILQETQVAIEEINPLLLIQTEAIPVKIEYSEKQKTGDLEKNN